MRDHKHAAMIRHWLSLNGQSAQKYEVEVPYNYYGSRGFIDLVMHFKGGTHHIIEFKTKIEDFGATIRQIKQAREFYPKTVGIQHQDIVQMLILLDTIENRGIYKENAKILEDSFIHVFFIPPKGKITDAGEGKFEVL